MTTFVFLLAACATVERILSEPVNQRDVRGPSLRVQQTDGGPRLFRDGRMIRPRFAYVGFGSAATPIRPEWTRVELPFVLPRDFDRLQIQMRFPQPSRTGAVELRDFSIRRADGRPCKTVIDGSFDSESVFAKVWRQTVGVGGGPALFLPQNLSRAHEKIDEHPFPTRWENGAWVTTLSPWIETRRPPDYTLVSAYFALEGGVDYILSYAGRSSVVDSVLPSLYQVSSDETNYASIPLGTDLPAVGTVKKAAEVGVNEVVYAPPMHRFAEGEDWRWNDLYCDRLVQANPKVLLIPRLTLDAPEWWLDRHPEHRMKSETGDWMPMSSIASSLYREMTYAYLVRLIAHMLERYPENFGGIQPTGQSTSEWFYQAAQVRLSGYDPSTRAAFRAWLKAHGRANWETAEVPSPTARRARTPCSVFIDAASSSEVLDFNQFLQDDLTDFLGEIFRLCRGLTKGRKIVISFYGYVYDFLCNGPGPAQTGHYGLQRLLDRSASDLDVLCAPISYINRGWTGTSMIMGAAESVERHGVMWFNENDARTYLAKPSMADSGPGLCLQTKTQTLDVLRRDLSREILRNYGSWWMDLQGRGWWNDREIWGKIRETEPMERDVMRRARPFTPEIALVVDEESVLRIGADTARDLGGLVHFRRPLSLVGAPFGQYLLSDVRKNGLEAKLQIYLATWFGEAAFREELRKSPPRGVTRVWVKVPGAPGYTTETVVTKNGIDTDVVCPLTALVPSFDPKFLNTFRPLRLYDLAEAAGVRLYLPRGDVGKAVVWASDGYVSVQALEDGEVTVKKADGDESLKMRKGECRVWKETAPVRPMTNPDHGE